MLASWLLKPCQQCYYSKSATSLAVTVRPAQSPRILFAAFVIVTAEPNLVWWDRIRPATAHKHITPRVLPTSAVLLTCQVKMSLRFFFLPLFPVFLCKKSCLWNKSPTQTSNYFSRALPLCAPHRRPPPLLILLTCLPYPSLLLWLNAILLAVSFTSCLANRGHGGMCSAFGHNVKALARASRCVIIYETRHQRQERSGTSKSRPASKCHFRKKKNSLFILHPL